MLHFKGLIIFCNLHGEYTLQPSLQPIATTVAAFVAVTIS